MSGGAPQPPVSVRPGRADDAPALLAIYAPFVTATAVTFETDVPSVDAFAARIDRALAGWQWLVAERAGRCVGYAYGSPHRERPAYRWSVEVSAYVDPAHQGQGIGGALYAQLLPALAALGHCNAYAGIALPNAPSVALHQRAGFTPIGVFRAVGRKFGRWHDVAWWQRTLREEPVQG